MLPFPHAFPVVQFLGVVIQFGGAALLAGLFALLRRFVIRRAYFGAWLGAWASFTIAIAALILRYLVPWPFSTADDQDFTVRVLYFVYQAGKSLGFILFLRGTRVYVAGGRDGPINSSVLLLGGLLLAAVSAAFAMHGLDEMVIWQGIIAVPTLVYCTMAFATLKQQRVLPPPSWGSIRISIFCST